MAESSKAVEYKAVLAVLVVAVVVLLLGIDIWKHSSDDDAESTGATASTTETVPAEPVAEPAACGNPRVVTVEDATLVRWELVRESDAATSACPRVTLYRDDESVSTFDLPAGVTFIDGEEGLWSYREGADAMPADQSVNNSELSKVWLIARTSDGRTVSANLEDAQLELE